MSGVYRFSLVPDEAILAHDSGVDCWCCPDVVQECDSCDGTGWFAKVENGVLCGSCEGLGYLPGDPESGALIQVFHR